VLDRAPLAGHGVTFKYHLAAAGLAADRLCVRWCPLQLSEKECNESTLRKHEDQMRDLISTRVAESQQLRGIVKQLQAEKQEQEGELVLVQTCCEQLGSYPAKSVLSCTQCAHFMAPCKPPVGPRTVCYAPSTPARQKCTIMR
jgi:hypothetical protein